jgi:hypothetical protein
MPLSDQEDLKRLRHVENTVLRNPAIKKKFFKLYKEADPQAQIPELEAEEARETEINSKIDEVKKELAETSKKLREREAQEINARERERLARAPYNLTNAEIDEVIGLQDKKYKEGELMSLESCAQIFLHTHSVPSGRSGPRLPFSTKGARPKDDFRKALMDPKSDLFKDPRGVTKRMADEAREELREAFGEVLI